MDEKDDKQKTKLFPVEMDEEVRSMLQAMAKADGRSMGEIVRRLIREAFAKLEAK